MASFFQSMHRNGIFHSWQESRRKSNTGWILLSVGFVLVALSFLSIRYSLFLILGSGISLILSVLLIIKGKLDWKKTIRVFEPANDSALLNMINRKIQFLPFVAVYESENPSKAVAIFTLTHSYILPLAQNNDIINIEEKFSEQMERILPLPWQHPTILEPVHNSMEIEAAIHGINEESPDSVITPTLLETIFQFAKVIQSFVIIGQPLFQINAGIKVGQELSSKTPSRKKTMNKKSVSFGFDIRRHTGLILLFVCIVMVFGVYYVSGRTGPTQETSYLDEFKIWIADKLPLEYHAYIGLGTLQDSIESNITAVTLHSTVVVDKVGGGQVLTHLHEGTEVNVIQEELVVDTYWYYINKNNTMGWVNSNDLIFKHLLPAKTVVHRLPNDNVTLFSSKRPIPFAIRQKYTTNNEEWLGIAGFSPITDVVWVRKGDYK